MAQSKNIFYGLLEKKTIFEIFLHYKYWKEESHQKHYDFMDIANHILAEIKLLSGMEDNERKIVEVFGSLLEKPDFNFLFLDEVQDLPPAVIYLISLVFSNGVYYSGDTAQAIQKGVSFKFSDIVDMFS